MEEILRINTLQKGIKLSAKELYQPFTQINCFHVSEYSQQGWEQAKALYSKNMDQPEREIANYLKQEIFLDLSNPTQAIKES
jgi:predicted GNAT superfamily acetyltransferase